jgi:hypothetical protein
MDDEHERSMRSEPLLANGRSPLAENSDDPMPSEPESRETVKPTAAGLMDEIQARKDKLSQLELQTKTEPSSFGEDQPSQSKLGANQSFHEPNPQFVKQMNEYRRMEQCLYNHRKEWEMSAAAGRWEYYEPLSSKYPERQFKSAG